MSRSVDNLKKLGSSGINFCAGETRIKNFDQLWAKFEAQHELIRSNYKDRYSEYATEFFDTVENTYVQQRSRLAEYAERYKIIPTTSVSSGEEQSSDLIPKTAPRIKSIPHFSARTRIGLRFKISFCSSSAIILQFPMLSGSSNRMQGPSKKLIQPLAVTDDKPCLGVIVETL